MSKTPLPVPRFLRHLARRVDRWRAEPASGLVLLYHRVADLERDPQLLSVSPRNFAQHLEIIRRCGRPVPLEEVVNAQPLRSGELPAIAVTFDDGYADNFHNAGPLLEQCGVPATVFVATGYLDGDTEFWWDELDRLLLEPGPLPAACALEVGQQRINYESNQFRRYDPQHATALRHWHVLDKSDPTDRHRLYRELCQSLRTLSLPERTRSLSELRQWAGRSPTGRSTHRAMSRQEVRQLDRSRLVDVGAHTVHHPVLSALGHADQLDEIQSSKAELEDLVGRPVRTFSYPFGTRSDYNDDSLTIVRQLGFSLACANDQGSVRPHDDRFQLKRRVVRNWSGGEFERHLRKWLRR